jgi:hypothetical protein
MAEVGMPECWVMREDGRGMELIGSRVRDGRHLMQNDYQSSRTVREGIACLRARVFDIPEHPNYRDRYQRVGDETA